MKKFKRKNEMCGEVEVFVGGMEDGYELFLKFQ